MPQKTDSISPALAVELAALEESNIYKDPDITNQYKIVERTQTYQDLTLTSFRIIVLKDNITYFALEYTQKDLCMHKLDPNRYLFNYDNDKNVIVHPVNYTTKTVVVWQYQSINGEK